MKAQRMAFYAFRLHKHNKTGGWISFLFQKTDNKLNVLCGGNKAGRGTTYKSNQFLLKRNHNKSQIKICPCSVNEAFSKHIKKNLSPKHQNTDHLFLHADINPHTGIKKIIIIIKKKCELHSSTWTWGPPPSSPLCVTLCVFCEPLNLCLVRD